MFVATGTGGDKRNPEESGEGMRAGACQYWPRSHCCNGKSRMAQGTENCPENSMEKENPEHNPILQSFVTLTGQQVSSVSEPMGSAGI